MNTRHRWWCLRSTNPATGTGWHFSYCYTDGNRHTMRTGIKKFHLYTVFSVVLLVLLLTEA